MTVNEKIRPLCCFEHQSKEKKEGWMRDMRWGEEKHHVIFEPSHEGNKGNRGF